MNKKVYISAEKDSIYDNKLNNFLFDKSKENFEALTKEEHEILGKRIRESLIGKKNKEYTQILGPNTEQSQFIEIMFRKYIEVVYSYETMEMIAVFVRQYPNYQSYKSNRITKTKYLKYHIENYFNEVYIFNLRLNALLRQVEKCSKEKGIQDERNDLKKLKTTIKTTLNNLTLIRGGHVHKKRYSDEEIDQLESLELYTQGGELKEKLEWFKNLQYRFFRNNWHKTLINNNKELNKLARFVADEISEIVINQLYPKYKP